MLASVSMFITEVMMRTSDTQWEIVTNLRKFKKVTSENDLGVLVDNKLLFREHIAKKVGTANLGLIFKTFEFMDKDMFVNLYKSLDRPHLEYTMPVIRPPRSKKDIISIENVQRRATHLVKSVSHLGYADRLKTLGLPTLEYRRERGDMIQVYKIVNNIDKVDKSKVFTMWLVQLPEATQKSCLKQI